MSNQKPSFPPNMYPFFFSYPPPGFSNPFMNPANKNLSIPAPPQRMGMPPYAMPYPGYFNNPMMYPPPPPQPYFRFPDPRMQMRPQEQSEVPATKEVTPLKPQQKKNGKQRHQTDEVNVIVLSDNQSNLQKKRDLKLRQKKEKKIQKKEEKEDSFEQRLRRTIRKAVPSRKMEAESLKPKLKERKRELKEQESKQKISRQEEKEIKVMIQSLEQVHCCNFSRSSRSKILSAKDGRGKIQIGVQFQAKIPVLKPLDQDYTMWSDVKKKDLFSRTFK